MTKMRWSEITPWVFSFAITAAGLLLTLQHAHAADLDRAYRPPREPYVAGGIQGAQIDDPRCRVILQPEANLYGDTTRFRPTLVCMSRGIYADFYKPYPAYNPYYSEFTGNFNPLH
jgi:hypothetical protein